MNIAQRRVTESPGQVQSLLLLLLAGALAGTAGCSSHPPPPVVERSTVLDRGATYYVVQAGDTLYSIAWRHDKDYRELARLNRIAPPYRILPGKRILLRGLGLSAPAKPAPTVTSSVNKPPASKPRPSGSTGNWQPGQWSWPGRGELRRRFGRSNKGFDIQLKPFTAVRAAAPGEVVYAGSGLRGYRYLIILKHDEHYLSAYGLNQNLKVKEGQKIKAGAQLADIVRRGSTAALLHFEIRKDGIPINPGRYLK